MKKNVLVFFGGQSTEHDISVLTGTMTAAEFSDRQIMTALQLTETQLEELRQEPPR